MQYNFDEIIDRRQGEAVKYLDTPILFGTDNLIPLWVADMDFKVADEIIEAAKKRSEHGIFGYVSRQDSYWDAIISWQQRRHGCRLNKDQLSFSPGVVPSIIALIEQLSEAGDLILIHPPSIHNF